MDRPAACAKAAYANANTLECANQRLPPTFVEAKKKHCIYMERHNVKAKGDRDAPAVDNWRCLWSASLRGRQVHVKAVSTVAGDIGAAASRTEQPVAVPRRNTLLQRKRCVCAATAWIPHCRRDFFTNF